MTFSVKNWCTYSVCYCIVETIVLLVCRVNVLSVYRDKGS